MFKAQCQFLGKASKQQKINKKINAVQNTILSEIVSSDASHVAVSCALKGSSGCSEAITI